MNMLGFLPKIQFFKHQVCHALEGIVLICLLYIDVIKKILLVLYNCCSFKQGW